MLFLKTTHASGVTFSFMSVFDDRTFLTLFLKVELSLTGSVAR